jgi:hypothetical protein
MPIVRYDRPGPRRESALQGQHQRGRAEHDTVVVAINLVGIAPVVEARLHLYAKRHLSPHDDYAPNQPVWANSLPAAGDGDEVLQLADSIRGEEASDQDVGVGEVELLGGPAAALGCDGEVTSATAVADRREYARRPTRPGQRRAERAGRHD